MLSRAISSPPPPQKKMKILDPPLLSVTYTSHRLFKQAEKSNKQTEMSDLPLVRMTQTAQLSFCERSSLGLWFHFLERKPERTKVVTFFNWFNNLVLWYIGAFTRLSRWEPGFESQHHHALLSFSKAILSTMLLSTQVYKWGPSRMCDRLLCLNLPAPLWQCVIGSFRQGMLRREWKLCTVSARHWNVIQWPG